MAVGETRVFVEHKPRAAHPYEGSGFMGYVMVSRSGVSELLERTKDRTLGMQAVWVLLTMIDNVDFENGVKVSQKEIAASLRMSQSDVSRASRALVECGFIEHTSHRGWYRINPRLLWRGASKTLKVALENAA